MQTLAPLILPLQQPPRDDVRLDLGGGLEDVEDAGVAQDAGDFVFHRVAVAAVDLQGVVGVGPGRAAAQPWRWRLTAAQLPQDSVSRTSRAPAASAASLPEATPRGSGAMPQLVHGKMRSGPA